jgi:hypothetical protein
MAELTVEGFKGELTQPARETAATLTRSGTSFWSDIVQYASRVKEFDRGDWIAYLAWVGLMLGLLGASLGFMLVGRYHGVRYPSYAWNIPLGIAIFVGAIAFDTIGHRTAYRVALQRGEALVHHITIFAGVTSCVLLSLAFTYPVFLRFPAWTFTVLSIFYSVIDEAMHWFRYYQGNSDRVEMWSHFFIFVGHLMFMIPWVYWFEAGYPGVAETVAFF